MAEGPAPPDRLLVVGRVVGVHGVAGWVKVESWTRPRENLFGFARWRLMRRGEAVGEARLVDGRAQGKGLVAYLEGVDDRDAARALMGVEIAVRRDDLPPTDEDEFYWADLEGLSVETVSGVPLGRVHHLFETGANDVMAVQGDRERLIPFVVDEVVVEVDLSGGRIRVDWDPDF